MDKMMSMNSTIWMKLHKNASEQMIKSTTWMKFNNMDEIDQLIKIDLQVKNTIIHKVEFHPHCPYITYR